eukprot:CAMPEP_0198137952 /NCGR_PEP_ID=MMETSP1443-20131203/1379_1 /TAXON_ID=186043 /ORGANISM="Entomoneis sp., Strain CCMP2396" /LENGTH=500 /DNA_ID=CAMNT_0043799541 /DNA_START=121 /DNA_END=1620 /DNA_ORIENTATION=+
MSFSSRRRNYLLTPHRRDGLIEWMKSMLQHSFVLDALETTGADTFTHFEALVEEHRQMDGSPQPSRLQQLVPQIGMFHTSLFLRAAFTIYNEKHCLTKRKHIQISFNEIRHILNLAQILAMRKNLPGQENATDLLASTRGFEEGANVSSEDDDSVGPLGGLIDDGEDTGGPSSQLNGPKLISFDGDQTLYSDGANFDNNPRLARYMELLLRHGVAVAVVTAAGYEYKVDRYEHRLSGLLNYFKKQKLSAEECERFYLFGGECNYLLQLKADYHLHPVKEIGPGGWITSTQYLPEAPANWEESKITDLLDIAEKKANAVVKELRLRGRVIRKKRSVGLIPNPGSEITRESLDEAVLSYQEVINSMNGGAGPGLPYCAFNGGTDTWVDVGNKRVGVQILQSYLGIQPHETLHIGDQFLNTGNDFAARTVSPCIWIISPVETTYILKSILRLAGVNFSLPDMVATEDEFGNPLKRSNSIDFLEMQRRTAAAKKMDVYTGELVG